MGAIASQYADYVVVTDDNPRFEDAETIRQQILTACPQAQEIGNRRQAIHSTIAQLGEGDVLLIAGKGHETGQIVGHTVHPFDDKTEVENFLKEHT
jgi:UDP-N-acetylmuramoyl-L-alanyl-D-glutamate--2,6-diaminopimelate ligase